MKKIILLSLSFVAFSQLALAATPASNPLEYLRTADPGTTPFQKLDTLFKVATAANLGQFELYTGASVAPNSRNWKCSSVVDANATLESITVDSRIIYHVIGKVLAGSTKAAVPGTGPLFPGVPGVPAQDEYRDALLWAQQGFSESQVQLGETMTTENMTLTATATELSETFRVSAVYTFRTMDDLLFVQSGIKDEHGGITAGSYEYCWMEAPAPTPAPEQPPMPHRSGD